MESRKAVYYGKVELIPGEICDGYVLNDGTACLSERGTAILLKMDHKTLEAMGGNWPPKILKPFVDKVNPMGGNSAQVIAKNSPYLRNVLCACKKST